MLRSDEWSQRDRIANRPSGRQIRVARTHSKSRSLFRFRPRGPVFGTAAAALLALACASSRPWEVTPWPATDLPGAFLVDGPEPAAGACPGRIRDPRDGTRLTLRRSIGGRAPSGGALGDFAVTPSDRYGGSPDRLLRVDCSTGRPLGQVPA